MVGRSGDFNPVDPAAGDAGDHPNGCTRLMQGGALLNVQLKVGRQLALAPTCLLHPAHVAADVGQTSAHQHTLVVNGGQVGIFHQSSHDAAAE